jgi:CheY-like chemotaxis protein
MSANAGKLVLVVEDQRLLRLAIRDTLELEGYEVVTAGDGIEALEVMEKRGPDLIIADIMMPRMDGYAFYEAVRARPEAGRRAPGAAGGGPADDRAHRYGARGARVSPDGG